MRKSTVTSIRKAYLEGVREKRVAEGDVDLALLLQKKRGGEFCLEMILIKSAGVLEEGQGGRRRRVC